MKTLTLLAWFMMMFGCSSGDSGDREETVGKEIADDYNEAMDKAREIENQMQEQKEKMDAALREAEQGPQDP